MPLSLRVRLYRDHATEPEADTDPDAPEGTPGAEIVADLAASQRALVELCQAMHGAARLLGFADETQRAYWSMLRTRAHETGGRFTYNQGYSVLHDTAEARSATFWRARVDIAVSP